MLLRKVCFMIEKRLNELFSKCLTPEKLELSKEELSFLKENSDKYPMAELCLILFDFSKSRILYSFNGEIDEHDEIQAATFVKLDALGKIFPLAYKVAGELYLGTMGKIIWHSDRALKYYEQYAKATGDYEIIDNYDKYTDEKWSKYKRNMHLQRARRIREEYSTSRSLFRQVRLYETLGRIGTERLFIRLMQMAILLISMLLLTAQWQNFLEPTRLVKQILTTPMTS